MKDKSELKGMTKDQLKGCIIRECPSEYGLNDAKGCDGSGNFSCHLCWESALDAMEGEE